VNAPTCEICGAPLRDTTWIGACQIATCGSDECVDAALEVIDDVLDDLSAKG